MKTQMPGPFCDLIKKHLALRRSLGYLLRTDEFALHQFDAYAAENFPAAQTVLRPMISGYLQTIEDRDITTRRHQLTTLRQFCRFLFQLNADTYIPESNLLPPVRSQFRPHLYTLDEVTELINAARATTAAGRFFAATDVRYPHRFTLGNRVAWRRSSSPEYR